MRRALSILIGVTALPLAAWQNADWPQFGHDLAGSGSLNAATGITAANVASLQRRQIPLAGIVDASAIYLRAVNVKGSPHDTIFVTTSYGKTLAIDANAGVLWEYTPPKYDSWAGSRQITNSTPAADPDRQYIYAAAPDGTIQKLAIADGHALWTTPITLLPQSEKIASSLRVFRGHVIAVTGGYTGDRPPYQGHVAVLDASTGQLLHVWNSLCSDRPGLIQPDSCPAQRSAIWGRAGPVIDSATGNIFVATGNGPYDGKTSWGDAVVELDPDATRIVGNYTPSDNATLLARDQDLGSTSPALLGGDLLVQAGKAPRIELVSIKSIAGADPHQGNELQALSSDGRVFGAPAVWHRDAETWVFAADARGTEAWALRDGKLTSIWKNANAGTSPVVAGGLLYIYDLQGALRVYEPVQGTLITTLECGSGHWNSPIVVDGRIILPEGNANVRTAAAGVLDIWTLK
jgi:hypothetical protein